MNPDEPMSLIEGEEPLLSLLKGGVNFNELTEEQKRERILEFRRLRMDPRAMRARMEHGIKKREKKEREEEKVENKAMNKSMFDDLSE
jgi:hypothetical protein